MINFVKRTSLSDLLKRILDSTTLETNNGHRRRWVHDSVGLLKAEWSNNRKGGDQYSLYYSALNPSTGLAFAAFNVCPAMVKMAIVIIETGVTMKYQIFRSILYAKLLSQ